MQPLVIVTPLQDSHVQATIICCKKLNLELKVRSNGHDYEGISYVSDVAFVMLDLFLMNSIKVDVEEGSAWVQAGATLGELYYAIANESEDYGFSAGRCPTVGVGGHISGGGFGVMTRKFGLAADNILDAHLVDVNGEILNKTSMGDDLFWAIRGGGGGNFGVILSWKIKLVPVPKNVAVFTLKRDLEHGATSLVHKWQQIAHKLPEDLYIRVLLDRASEGGDAEKNRTIIATFKSLFLGEVEQLLDIMKQSFPELDLKSEECEKLSWIQSVIYFAGFDPYGPREVLLVRTLDTTQTRRRFFKSKSDYVKEPLTETELEDIWKMYDDPRVKDPHMLWVPGGGVMSAIPPSETPYPHRRNIYTIEYMAYWDERGSEVENENINWVRRLYGYMEPYVSKEPREAYINFRDLDLGESKDGNATYEQAKAWGIKYFMGNFDRLVKVKTEVDPENFFRNEQNIPVQPHFEEHA
ncbi:hypothetical protein Sjap_006480 [Stephania japonica]|uniref:FAD-binding PCMH-type domain-containing protein n=1 Tax=Stephania japonica TaxID=461633 RepID=A0AAP0K5Y8_9MAGN